MLTRIKQIVRKIWGEIHRKENKFECPREAVLRISRMLAIKPGCWPVWPALTRSKGSRYSLHGFAKIDCCIKSGKTTEPAVRSVATWSSPTLIGKTLERPWSTLTMSRWDFFVSSPVWMHFHGGKSCWRTSTEQFLHYIALKCRDLIVKVEKAAAKKDTIVRDRLTFTSPNS